MTTRSVDVRGWCAVHDAQAWDGRDLFCLLHPGDPEERSCQMERVLVIPIELGPFATSGQSDITMNDLRVVSRWLESDLSEKIVRKPTVGDLIAALRAEEEK